MARALIVALVVFCGSLAVAGCGDDEANSAELSTVASFKLKPKPPLPQGPHSEELIVKDMIEGSGAEVDVGDTISVHYVTGIYETGEETESGWVKGRPFTFELGNSGMLDGWEEGIPGMRVGGRRMLLIPSTPNSFPLGGDSNDTMVYVIDLIAMREES